MDNLGGANWCAFCLAMGLAGITGGHIPVSQAENIATDESGIEEIVVTTRRREENLQEVPISIGVFDAEDIARLGIRDLADITKLSPSLQFEKSFSQNSVRVTLRGLSNTRGRTNVAFLVDNIDVSSETTGTNAGSPLLVNQRLLTDVERIEVVKGPQSALYGRSAFAGAINYVSKNPAKELDGNIAVDVAEHGQQEVYGSVSVPLTDTLGLRVSGVSWDDDGYYRNQASGSRFGGGDGSGIAGTLLWEPAAAFSLKTRVSYTDEDYTPGAIAPLTAREITLDVPADAAPVTDATTVDLLPWVGKAGGLEVRSSEDLINGGDYPGNTLEVFRTSVNASWDINSDYTLNSYSGFTNANMTQRYDLDRQAEGRPDEILGHGDVDTYGNTKQYSQELRLSTDWENSAVQFTFGGLYWQEDRDDHSRNIVATCWDTRFCGNPGDEFESWQDIYAAVLENAQGYRNPIDTETKHGSAYVMLEWDITDQWRLTLEDRFVSERFETELYLGASCVNAYPYAPDLNFFQDPGCISGTKDGGSNRSSYQTPKVTVDWSVAENAMLYASAGKGQKPAGISLLTIPLPFPIPLDPYFYEPEKMWSYELGAKTNWSGSLGNLLFNTSAFYQDYSDKQTNTQQQVGNFLVGVVTNASSASVTGIELEASWETPVEGLRFGAAYTWLDTEYENFKDPTRSVSRITAAGTCGEVVVIRDTNHCELDLSGNELEYAPEHSLVLTGHYGHALFESGIDWFVESNASFQSERYTSADNYTQLDEYWLVDARVGLATDSWDVTAYLNNVFDDDTITSAGGNIDVAAGYVDSGNVAPPGLPTAFLPNPRTMGVRLRYHFQ